MQGFYLSNPKIYLNDKRCVLDKSNTYTRRIKPQKNIKIATAEKREMGTGPIFTTINES